MVMEFVTDRTETDVLLGSRKGAYGAADLNRVEANNKELETLLREIGEEPGVLTHKTDWNVPGAFSASEWPTAGQMARYLDNVHRLSAAFGVPVTLPGSMARLTWEGANQIEQQQQMLLNYINNTKAAWQQSGAAECGG